MRNLVLAAAGLLSHSPPRRHLQIRLTMSSIAACCAAVLCWTFRRSAFAIQTTNLLDSTSTTAQISPLRLMSSTKLCR